MRLSLLVFALLCTINARKGWDGIQAVSVAGFECLKNEIPTEFEVATIRTQSEENEEEWLRFLRRRRVWTEVGDFDMTGISNIKNARAAGWTNVSAYIYPCTSSNCASGGQQVEATILKLEAEGVHIDILWMDIEGTWPADQEGNRQFIFKMVIKAAKMGFKSGIYTGQYSWAQITGDWKNFGMHPLWWPNYDGEPGFEKFVPYGGWTKPAMQQYKGTTAGPCGVSMDLNYIP